MKGLKGFQKGHGRFRTDESYVISGAKIRIAKLGVKRSESFRTKMSILLKGRSISPETQFKKGDVPFNKGKNFLQVTGDKHYAWKGGIASENEKIRHSLKYRQWRQHVFNRDNYTCQSCGTRGGELHADHELPFALFPALRLEVLNGRTLCVICHRKTPSYGWSKIYSSGEFIY